MEENYSLKDMFNSDTLGQLSEAIAAAYPKFPEKTFLNGVFDEDWNQRALKERVRHITETLKKHLPIEYKDALEVLSESLPLLGEQGFEKMLFRLLTGLSESVAHYLFEWEPMAA